MSVHKHGTVIQVPVVVNSNTAQVLVVTEIPLTPPAFRIDEIQKLIEIDDSISGQVVVVSDDMSLRNSEGSCGDISNTWTSVHLEDVHAAYQPQNPA